LILGFGNKKKEGEEKDKEGYENINNIYINKYIQN
jgi:hypothetical protein